MHVILLSLTIHFLVLGGGTGVVGTGLVLVGTVVVVGVVVDIVVVDGVVVDCFIVDGVMVVVGFVVGVGVIVIDSVDSCAPSSETGKSGTFDFVSAFDSDNFSGFVADIFKINGTCSLLGMAGLTSPDDN